MPDTGRHSRRTKQLDVVPRDDGSFSFTTSLVDESFEGDYETAARSLVVHQFFVDGDVDGGSLQLTRLAVRAEEHPFPQCPFVLPVADDLVGLSLAAGWRRQVLDRLGGARGCTHVTTLLLGLSEVTTLIYFQRRNAEAPYGPRSRASGEWIGGSLDLAPGLAGACHVLSEDGPVIRLARHHQAAGGGEVGTGGQQPAAGATADHHRGDGPPGTQSVPVGQETAE